LRIFDCGWHLVKIICYQPNRSKYNNPCRRHDWTQGEGRNNDGYQNYATHRR